MLSNNYQEKLTHEFLDNFEILYDDKNAFHSSIMRMPISWPPARIFGAAVSAKTGVFFVSGTNPFRRNDFWVLDPGNSDLQKKKL